MGDVVDFAKAKEEREPHLCGKAVCMHCQYGLEGEWEAVAPVGTVFLQCPQCSLIKGIYVNPILDEENWECNCGNGFFAYSHRLGMYCPNCGVTQEGCYD